MIPRLRCTHAPIPCSQSFYLLSRGRSLWVRHRVYRVFRPDCFNPLHHMATPPSKDKPPRRICLFGERTAPSGAASDIGTYDDAVSPNKEVRLVSHLATADKHPAIGLYQAMLVVVLVSRRVRGAFSPATAVVALVSSRGHGPVKATNEHEKVCTEATQHLSLKRLCGMQVQCSASMPSSSST